MVTISSSLPGGSMNMSRDINWWTVWARRTAWNRSKLTLGAVPSVVIATLTPACISSGIGQRPPACPELAAWLAWVPVSARI